MDNAVLKHFFNEGRELDPQHRFDLSRKNRYKRLREILGIAHKHKITRGFTPVGFRRMLEDMGPSFVKIGQMLSTRAELLPPAYCEELSNLQTSCDPLPYDEVVAALVAEYPQGLDQVFSRIDPNPLGSASLAQVHRATLLDGTQVAVKVQRPGVRNLMARDIDVLRSLARRASVVMSATQMLDVQQVVEEMWVTFLEETDFICEARNLVEFKRLNAEVRFIDCPQVYMDLCTENVLVMEYIDGIPIRDRKRLEAAGYDVNEIGLKLLDNYATQILDHGFFHADPHPGNMVVRAGQVVYIDLGIMGRLTPRDRGGFSEMIRAVGANDTVELKSALINFAVARDPEGMDNARFLDELDHILASYGSCDVADIDISEFLNDILQITRECKVTLPSSITNVARGIVTLEGTIEPYIPNDNMIDIINSHLKANLDYKDELARAMRELALSLRSAGGGITEAASYSGEAMRQLTRGQLRVNMEMMSTDRAARQVSRMVTRLSLSMVAAGLFVGSALLSTSNMGPILFGVPLMAEIGFVAGAVITIWTIIDIRRYRPPR